jgi:hypothetical protein
MWTSSLLLEMQREPRFLPSLQYQGQFHQNLSTLNLILLRRFDNYIEPWLRTMVLRVADAILSRES